MSRRVYFLLASFVLVLAIIGCGANPDDDTIQTIEAATIIRITVDENGFTPSKIDLSPDATAVLEFIRTSDLTCATAVLFPESGLRHELPLDEPIRITVRPREGQEIAFACPMDMYKGSFGTIQSDGAPKLAAPSASQDREENVIEIKVDRQGFHPNRIEVPAGQASVLRFTRVAENTCNTGVLIPDLSVEREFPFNETVDVTIFPEGTGQLTFSCPMKMSTGVIEVVEGESR